MYRHVEGREPVFDDALLVTRLEIGERGEVAVLKGEPVVVVADVENLAQALRQPVDEAEITAIGAAADSWWLDRDAERLGQRALDLEFDLTAVGAANLERELLLGG